MKGIIVALVLVNSLMVSADCNGVVLQEDVEFPLIAGKWQQLKFTNHSQYDEMTCFGLDFYEMDPIEKTLSVKSTFRRRAVKKGMNPNEFEFFETYANWGTRVPGQPFIGDHIATDYFTYVMLYQCDMITGLPVVDLELRQGVSYLPTDKVLEVEELLERLGTSLGALKTSECYN